MVLSCLSWLYSPTDFHLYGKSDETSPFMLHRRQKVTGVSNGEYLSPVAHIFSLHCQSSQQECRHLCQSVYVSFVNNNRAARAVRSHLPTLLQLQLDSLHIYNYNTFLFLIAVSLSLSLSVSLSLLSTLLSPLLSLLSTLSSPLSLYSPLYSPLSSLSLSLLSLSLSLSLSEGCVGAQGSKEPRNIAATVKNIWRMHVFAHCLCWRFVFCWQKKSSAAEDISIDEQQSGFIFRYITLSMQRRN